jgi:hypothetical protein
MHSLKAQQKGADAAFVESQFNSSWKNADTILDLATL